MIGLIIPLVVILVILLLIVLLILVLRGYLQGFLMKYFGTKDLKEAIEQSEVEAQETPKSVASMESVLMSSIKSDFPDLNINEIKSMAEKGITDYLNAINSKDMEIVSIYNDTIKSMVEAKINDSNEYSYSKIKFHRTVVNKYEKSKSIATLVLESSLEYYYKENKKINKKVQDRFKVELIYIIDASLVDKDKKLLGLNCPNCGAPITTLGEKYCKYCNTGIKDLVKRTWVINNIKSF